MNTDKIYAESIANQYAPKDTSKVVALRKLDAHAKRPAAIFTYTFGIAAALGAGLKLRRIKRFYPFFKHVAALPATVFVNRHRLAPPRAFRTAPSGLY